MQAMPFPKILAMVEGTMERIFINNNFSYVEVITLNNGSGWSIDKLCEQITTKYKVKNANPDWVIIWIDMEKKNCDPEFFRNKILCAMLSIGVEKTKLAICVPNRMTENIILADEHAIYDYLGLKFNYEHEGKNGKHILSGLFGDVGKTYRKTFDGVILLKKIRLQRAALKSKSAKAFVDAFKHPCWWVNADAVDHANSNL